MKRRDFVAAGSAMAGALRAQAKLRVGLIGAGGRGRYVAKTFLNNPDVTFGAVCDVYEPNLEKGLSETGNQGRAYRNYKQLLADATIPVVLIATPEHWHHRMVLDALAAGKDVYVEKPLCHTWQEGVELVAAARKSKSVVQVGMQRRSYDAYLKGHEVVAAGELGKVRMIRSWWINNQLNRQSRPLAGPLDWEQWQGPALKRGPLDPDRFNDWRSYTEYSGGIVADQGAHAFDGMNMLTAAGYPTAVNASAGPPLRPKVDTAESVVVCAEYAAPLLAVFSVNYAAMRYESKNDQLSQLDGDAARMDIGRVGFRVFRQGAEDKPASAFDSPLGFGNATNLHVTNFLECVKTRATPTAPVEIGFQSALPVLLANLSLKLGRRVKWNATKMAAV